MTTKKEKGKKEEFMILYIYEYVCCVDVVERTTTDHDSGWC